MECLWDTLYTSYSLRFPWLSSKDFDLSSDPGLRDASALCTWGMECVGAASRHGDVCGFWIGFCRTQALSLTTEPVFVFKVICGFNFGTKKFNGGVVWYKRSSVYYVYSKLGVPYWLGGSCACELGGHSISILVKSPALGTTSLPELAVMHPWGVSVLYIIPGFCRSCQCTVSPLPYLDKSSWCKNMKINQKSRRSTDWYISCRLVIAVAVLVGAAGYLKMSWTMCPCLFLIATLILLMWVRCVRVSLFFVRFLRLRITPLNVYLMLVFIKAVVLSF